MLPLCGKTGETGFHGVENFPKNASMVWKNAESGFHCVENFADLADFARAIFPSAPTGTKPGSMPWNFFRKWVPCHGKTAEFGFHAVENGRKWVPWCGKLRGLCGLRASLSPHSTRQDATPPEDGRRGFQPRAAGGKRMGRASFLSVLAAFPVAGGRGFCYDFRKERFQCPLWLWTVPHVPRKTIFRQRRKP